jgi:DNA-binding response OmpR family regulator
MKIDAAIQEPCHGRFTLSLRADLAKSGTAGMTAGFDTSTYRILVLDDNYSMLRLVSSALQKSGFQVTTATSGEQGLEQIRRNGLPHLALVDIHMPYGMNGFEFCDAILNYSDVPIIMLTAVDEDETIIQTIDQYAEDYITKPFNPGELVARVRRVLRRIGDFAYTLSAETVVDEHLTVSFPYQRAIIDGQEVALTPTETKLLFILMRNAGQTVTTDFILRRLWPMETVFEDRLRVYVHRLRRKIERQPEEPRYILSQRGVGYSFARP